VFGGLAGYHIASKRFVQNEYPQDQGDHHVWSNARDFLPIQGAQQSDGGKIK
jgi:hypothetical protein